MAAVAVVVLVAAIDAVRGRGGSEPPPSPAPAFDTPLRAELSGLARMVDGAGRVIYCPPPSMDVSGNRVYADEDECVVPEAPAAPP